MSFKIPFVSLFTNETEKVFPTILAGLRETVESSQFILGNKVDEFERSFAEQIQSKYAVGVNSGLDALILTLRALGIGHGDEVITPPNSFIASTAAISLVGATPVFVDVDWDYNINPFLIERAITKRTKAIIPVHLTGNPCKMDEIKKVANDFQLKVIEDAAQSFGAFYRKRPTGALADAGCFSLHPLKNLHVWGDGGVVTTNDEELYVNLKKQRNHGLINRDEAEFFSFNSRLDTIQALVGLAFIRVVSEVTRRRNQNALTYLSQLNSISDWIQLPSCDPLNRSAWHVFQICTDFREELIEHLSRDGIETKIHYPIPIHIQKAAKHLGFKPGDFPVTEKLSKKILSLPVRENLTEDEIGQVIDSIKTFFVRKTKM